jgi:hypothetical protein
MKSLESFSENVIGFQTVHAIIGHRVCPCDLFLRYNERKIENRFHRRKAYEV